MKKNYKKRVAQSVLCMMLALCMVVCGMMIAEPGTVQAATKESENAGSGYKMLFNNMTGEEYPVKTGRYYVKQKYSRTSKGFSVNVYVSTKKKSGYKRIPYCHTMFIATNGKYAYYTHNISKKSKLYRYTFSTGKAEYIGTIPSKQTYAVEYVMGNSVILYDGNNEDTGALYEYNLKTKKFKTLLKKNKVVYYLELVADQYMAVSYRDSDDFVNEKYLLCEITPNGTKVVKRLSKLYTMSQYSTIYDDGNNPYAANLAYSGNKIYYMVENGDKKINVYEYNKTTKKTKVVANMKFAREVTASSDYAIAKFTSKYCIYRYDWDKCRKVTYSTGKTVKVKYIEHSY